MRFFLFTYIPTITHLLLLRTEDASISFKSVDYEMSSNFLIETYTHEASILGFEFFGNWVKFWVLSFEKKIRSLNIWESVYHLKRLKLLT